MPIGTYSELQSAIAGWLNREDLTARIPDFIALAEARLSDDLRVRQMEERATAPFNEEYEPLPSDFLEMRQLKLLTNPIATLIYKTPTVLDTDSPSTAPGQPVFYTIIGSEVRLKPPPDTTYTAELVYYQSIPALSDAAPTNWLLTSRPNAYLYASLIEAAPYLGDDERIKTWEFLYTRAIEQITQADERARWNGAALTVQVQGGIA